jgi:hypothetical protein
MGNFSAKASALHFEHYWSYSRNTHPRPVRLDLGLFFLFKIGLVEGTMNKKRGLKIGGEKEGESVAAYFVVGGPAGVGRNRFVIMVANIFVPFHTYHVRQPSASHVTINSVTDC